MLYFGYLLGVDADAQTSPVPQRLNLLGGHIGEHRPGCAQGIKCLPPARVARLGRPVHGLDPRIKCRGAPIEASIRGSELHGAGGQTPMDVASDASFAAGKAFIAEVRAAGGTWKKWLRAPHRDVIRLRSLLVRKRATTSDPVLAFVFRLGDNGVFWKLLGFWPGRVLPPGVRY